MKKNLCCFLLPGWLYNGIFYYISLKLNHLMQLFGESASAKIETFAESPSRHSLPFTVVFNHDHAPCDQTNLQNTGPSLQSGVAGRVPQFQIRHSQYLEKAPTATFSLVKVMVLTVSHFKNL